MLYSWPLATPDPVLQEALDIAMDYLEFTRQAFPETECICANIILQSWRQGTRHPIRLANDAIVAIEKNAMFVEDNMWSFYPRVS